MAPTLNSEIHPTALVHHEARLGSNVSVGPFCTVGPHVEIGDRTELISHVVVDGWTKIGSDCRLFPFAVIGLDPQHLKYQGEPTRVDIGNNVLIRESVTIHRGTVQGAGITKVSDEVMIMAYSHVAHDCIVGKNVILANNVQLAGHVEVGEYTFIGGQSGVAQFCRVGKNSYIGGGSIIRKDLPPFLLGKGTDFEVQGINKVGLERCGYDSIAIRELKELFKVFYIQQEIVGKAIETISTRFPESKCVYEFIEFIKQSKNGFTR